jgi:hypothetical protein
MVERILAGPLAIGGVGGSGTRLIAEIASKVGYYIGGDLNVQGDNLWFTLLLRRPQWYAEEVAKGGDGIGRVLEIFESAMTGRLELDDELRVLVAAAGSELLAQRMPPRWIERRTKSLFLSRKLVPKASRWGWKEPNTHVYLNHLDRTFGPRLRYVHVIRHGLDMAWSRNQRQARRWGPPLFGIVPSAGTEQASTSLDYWIMSNKRAIALGQQLLGDRFLLINVDALCAAPEESMPAILDFLEVKVSQRLLRKILSLPRVPSSTGRYRAHGLGHFTAGQLAEVTGLGFSVEE